MSTKQLVIFLVVTALISVGLFAYSKTKEQKRLTSLNENEDEIDYIQIAEDEGYITGVNDEGFPISYIPKGA